MRPMIDTSRYTFCRNSSVNVNPAVDLRWSGVARCNHVVTLIAIFVLDRMLVCDTLASAATEKRLVGNVVWPATKICHRCRLWRPVDFFVCCFCLFLPGASLAGSHGACTMRRRLRHVAAGQSRDSAAVWRHITCFVFNLTIDQIQFVLIKCVVHLNLNN